MCLNRGQEHDIQILYTWSTGFNAMMTHKSTVCMVYCFTYRRLILHKWHAVILSCQLSILVNLQGIRALTVQSLCTMASCKYFNFTILLPFTTYIVLLNLRYYPFLPFNMTRAVQSLILYVHQGGQIKSCKYNRWAGP